MFHGVGPLKYRSNVMPQYHGVTMMKSSGPASAVNRCATRSMFVKRQFKSLRAAGIAMIDGYDGKTKNRRAKMTARQRQAQFKAAAARAISGRKYHGSVFNAANQRNPAKPAMAVSNVTPAKSGRFSVTASLADTASVGGFAFVTAREKNRLNSRSESSPATISSNNSQKYHRDLGRDGKPEKTNTAASATASVLRLMSGRFPVRASPGLRLPAKQRRASANNHRDRQKSPDPEVLRQRKSHGAVQIDYHQPGIESGPQRRRRIRQGNDARPIRQQRSRGNRGDDKNFHRRAPVFLPRANRPGAETNRRDENRVLKKRLHAQNRQRRQNIPRGPGRIFQNQTAAAVVSKWSGCPAQTPATNRQT